MALFMPHESRVNYASAFALMWFFINYFLSKHYYRFCKRNMDLKVLLNMERSYYSLH